MKLVEKLNNFSVLSEKSVSSFFLCFIHVANKTHQADMEYSSNKSELSTKHYALMTFQFSHLFLSICLIRYCQIANEKLSINKQVLWRFLPFHIIFSQRHFSMSLKIMCQLCWSIIKIVFTTVVTTIKGNYDVKIRQTVFDLLP